MSNTYGGDEINAIVLDGGSQTTRIGFAGDDFPKIVTPLAYAELKDGKKYFGETIHFPRPQTEIKTILEDLLITDWDAAVEQYTHAFEKDMKIAYDEQPILITEPIWSTTTYRKQLVETFYENFGFPALFLARQPTCVSFQQGRANCLVVDIGHDTVSATPVIDGISLTRNLLRTHYAGKYLNLRLVDTLDSKFNIPLIPRFKIASKVIKTYPEDPEYKLRVQLPETLALFDEFEAEKILHEMKETLLEAPEKRLVLQNPTYNASAESQYLSDKNERTFEFPTGQNVVFGIERFQIADSMFEPKSYPFNDEGLEGKYPGETGEIDFLDSFEDYKPIKRGGRKNELAQLSPPPGEKDKGGKNGPRGLLQLVSQTLASVDIDLRLQVAHNVIVTGGTSLIPQLTERLYMELSQMNPGLKVRLHATGNTLERHNQLWIGGSVLALLGTFHQMWVTKEEWDEAGSERILSQRFR